MRMLSKAAMLAAVLMLGAVAPAASAFADDAPKADAAKDKDKIDLPPFPADATVKQVTHVAGKTLSYTATVGSLPVRDEKGKKIAEVVFTAYILDGPREPRPAGDLRLQRRPGRGLGLPEPRRHRAQARAVRRPGRQPLRPRQAGRQSRHLARLHRPGVHRSGRHRLLPLAGRQGRDQEALLFDQAGHRVPVAHRLRLAAEERPDGLAQVRHRRELRRLPRAAHHLLPADPARRRRQRRGDGLALPRAGADGPGAGLLADALGRDPAVDGGGQL